MYLHPFLFLHNEGGCCEISDDKIAVWEKTAGLRSGNFSDLNSAVPVKVFQTVCDLKTELTA